MDASSAIEQLRCIRYTAGINQRYHQFCEYRWGIADKLIRAAVGILAVIGMWASMNGPDSADFAEILSVVSLGLAVALNVVPSGEREKFHGELFHRWSDLRRSAELLNSRLADGKDPSPAARERLSDLLDLEQTLHGCEPAPWRGLLLRCQEDENEHLYGPDCRTHEQLQARRNLTSLATVASEPGAPA